MRILVASTAYYFRLDGQDVFTLNLAEGLARRGHEVVSLFTSDSGQAKSGEQNGVRLEALNSIHLAWLHPEAYMPAFFGAKIRSIFDDFQPEIVHVQDHFPVCRAVVREANKRGIKIVGTNHFMPENVAQYVPMLSRVRPLFNWIAWRWVLSCYNRLDVVTAQSRASADMIRANGLRVPVHPVSCGINFNRFHPLPSVDRLAVRARYGLDPNRKLFLFVGRLEQEKRVDVLLHALKKLNRSDVQLVIAGHGTAQNELQTLAKSLGVWDRVRFTGFVPNEDLTALLNSIDIFTMPSEAELLSIASLEAMACGRPLLLANAVALPELVTQGANGYLFKPGDPEDAARYMSLLADHPEQWEAMGKASLEKAQAHSLENTIQRYEALYRETLK